MRRTKTALSEMRSTPNPTLSSPPPVPITVVNTGSDMELLAAPTRDRSQPTMLVARSGGVASGFLKLSFEPGWSLRRRAYGEKGLGHIYVYRDAAPQS